MSAAETLMSGGLWLAIPIALAAGILSFLSPCVLPLVPGYLGYVSGTTQTDGTVDTTRRTLRRSVAGIGLFVLGYSLVFLPLFLLAGTVGRFLLEYKDVLLRVGGVVCILLGLVFIGFVTVLQRDLKLQWRPRAGLLGAPLLGIVFAIGWTPCISPTLTAVSTLATYAGDPWRALALGVAYCLGLGVPFLLVALGFGWVGSSIAWVKRHLRAINIAGGVLLILVGILMVSGLWTLITSSIGAVIGGVVNPL